MNKFVLYWTVKNYFFSMHNRRWFVSFQCFDFVLLHLKNFTIFSSECFILAHIFEQFCYHFNCWFSYESMCILFYFSSADFFNSARFGESTTVQYIDIVRNFWKQNVFYKYNLFRQ